MARDLSSPIPTPKALAAAAPVSRPNMTDGRPFSTLGVRPFLVISLDDWKLVERRYRDLSRACHPDRVDPNDEAAMAAAEAASARLNSDYATLRDYHRRL